MLGNENSNTTFSILYRNKNWNGVMDIFVKDKKNV